MKSIILYSSNSGNTKKLAEAIHEAIPGNKEITPTTKAPDDLSSYDLICVGFWLMAGQPDPHTTTFLETINDKNLFLFATHGAAKDSEHAQNGIKAARELASGNTIVDTFNCPGEVNPKVIEKAKTKPQLPAWVPDAADAVGHPDGADLVAVQQAITNALQSLA